MTDLVSVIIPTYNRCSELQRALSSVLSQTHKNLEVIIVDNNSTDETDQMIKNINDERVRLLKINNNGIIASSRNLGINSSVGKWIAFLDSDDWWTSNKLEKIIPYLNSGYEICYHDLKIIRVQVKLNFFQKKIHAYQVKNPVFNDLIQLGNALSNSSVVVRASLIKQIGGLSEDPNLIGSEDYDTWIRLSRVTDKFRYIPETLGYYSIGTSDSTNPILSISNLNYVDRKYISEFNKKYKLKQPIWWIYAYARALYLNGEITDSRSLLKKLLKQKISVSLRVKSYFMITLKKINFTKKVMSLWQEFPDPDDYANWEVFKQNRFKLANDDIRNKMLYNSVDFNYSHEKDYCTISKYFPENFCKDFQNKTVLDLGSFTGGRLVRWVEKFHFSDGFGIDINPIFKEAGEHYLKEKNKDLSRIQFHIGTGESLPFENDTFDFIFSYDVLEHVQDVAKTIEECRRVLKKGGKMFLVFPQFYQPFESHLGFVTKLPAVHLIFNPKKIANSYYEIIKERGESAAWYGQDSPSLSSWEKLISLNGTTVRKFNRILKNSKFTSIYKGSQPIFSDGRRAEKYLFFKILKFLCWFPAKVPFLDEIFLGRVVRILRKD